MSRGDTQVNLRLPDSMRDQIRDAAAANKRSMNAEFVARIEQSFAEQASIASISNDLEQIKRALIALLNRS